MLLLRLLLLLLCLLQLLLRTAIAIATAVAFDTAMVTENHCSAKADSEHEVDLVDHLMGVPGARVSCMYSREITETGEDLVSM